MDVTLASAGLVLLLPGFLIIALLICLESGWSPIYVQERIGLGGVPFRMWKFRTMVNGADALRSDLALLNEAPFPAFKVRGDPRVTRVGRVLRRTSIDELPQLWNVVRLEMSLVGPRPALPEEVAQYDTVARRRLRARPGMTGMWQIANRRGELRSFDDWVAQDLRYISCWSLRLDAILVGQALLEIVRMSGA